MRNCRPNLQGKKKLSYHHESVLYKSHLSKPFSHYHHHPKVADDSGVVDSGRLPLVGSKGVKDDLWRYISYWYIVCYDNWDVYPVYRIWCLFWKISCKKHECECVSWKNQWEKCLKQKTYGDLASKLRVVSLFLVTLNQENQLWGKSPTLALKEKDFGRKVVTTFYWKRSQVDNEWWRTGKGRPHCPCFFYLESLTQKAWNQKRKC